MWSVANSSPFESGNPFFSLVGADAPGSHGRILLVTSARGLNDCFSRQWTLGGLNTCLSWLHDTFKINTFLLSVFPVMTSNQLWCCFYSLHFMPVHFSLTRVESLIFRVAFLSNWRKNGYNSVYSECMLLQNVDELRVSYEDALSEHLLCIRLYDKCLCHGIWLFQISL